MKIKNHTKTITTVITVLFLVCLVNVNAQEKKWNLKLSGVMQQSTEPRESWYLINPGTIDGEAGVNGLQGISFGMDIGLEYLVSKRIGIEGSISYIPTRMHGGTHITQQEIFSEPTGFITFLPLKIIANYYLKKSEKWNISMGPMIGIGFMGEIDLIPDVGRPHHFNGKNGILYGGQICFDRKLSGSKWSILATLRYMNTSYEVSEVGTGDLRMDRTMAPISLQFGTAYSF